MFGKLKDWRRIHTRYDRCAHTFMSAIAVAAVVVFYSPIERRFRFGAIHHAEAFGYAKRA
jgi:hypothetical protein